MNSELKILEALWNLGGEALFYTVAKTAGFNTDYARIICRTLGQNDYVDWFGSILILRPKGKLEVAKLKMNISDKEKRSIKEEEEIEKEISSISKNLLPHHRIDEAATVEEEDYRQRRGGPKRFEKKRNHMVLDY